MASKYLTDEEREALKKVSTGGFHGRYMDRTRHASTACFHAISLKQWMKNYAEWLALQPGRPGRPEKIAVANRMAHDKVSLKALRHLEARPDFLEYHDRFAAGAVTQARAQLESQAPWYMDKHKDGLEMAIKEGDYKAIPNYTSQVLERVWPRREEPVVSQQITIHITPRQQADLLEPAVELLPAEIVEEPPDPA